ncbi:MAG: CotH kinase family protein [Flavobacteriales bacterium]|nr:CotH kinase family protein [Flavobacteriales bacterium]
MSRSASILLFLVPSFAALGQGLPSEMYLDQPNHMLKTGGLASTGLYEKETIRTLDLQFPQANYWTLMTQNYNSQTDIPATLTVDGDVYDSVGVRFKGQTSYSMVSNSQKKSFNITLDHAVDDQDLMGYQTLNLNNAFDDASFLREVIYLDLIRDHVPAAKANFVHLNINGSSWGIYPNVQQINNEFVKEWFFSNNGTLWRADRPAGSGGGPGGGGGWGDGTAALNDLGSDTSTYKQYYTLKRTERINPWDDLVRVCQKLEQTPLAALEDSLNNHLDVDRTLWFLASEIAFSDDDSYVYKGKMDYYLYFDAETKRMTPQEFDGNSVMKNNAVAWGPFYHADNVNYPLLNRMLAVPSMRQRYLAHLRTLINEKMQSAGFNALLSGYSSMIDAEVQADPKKLYTYAAFNSELTVLQSFITNRRNNLLANSEVAQLAPLINDVSHRANNVEWADPLPSESVSVTTTIANVANTGRVDLFYCLGPYGKFTQVQMFDDGAHNDGGSGDGVFGASIPEAPSMTRVRYYVKATANNTAQSVSFAPVGAEHDVYTYLVQVVFAADPVLRINELMAQNTSGAQDENSQYEDWIELYNTSSQPFDLTGGWLSDNASNVYKWQFPTGSIIGAGDYLVVWADEDASQGPYHASFKLSGSGEEVLLAAPNGSVMDHIVFGEQQANMGYARIPNGTGPFVIQNPTFNFNNESSTAVEDIAQETVGLFPNPAMEHITFALAQPGPVTIRDAVQRLVWSGLATDRMTLDISDWAAGTYFVQNSLGVTKLAVVR